jgi:hypothetical protein
MSYQRKKSSDDIWRDYCKTNSIAIDRIGLASDVFKSEKNFRQYLTDGTLIENEKRIMPLSEISDEALKQLIDFVNRYEFDMDTGFFDAYNKQRIKRG